MSAKVTCVCPTCGKSFTRYPSEIRRGRRFCSHACGMVALRRPPVELTCPTCGKEFSVPPGKAKPSGRSPRRFCSPVCAYPAYGPHRHGAASQGEKTPEYNSWQMMRQRCLNPKATGYEKYGGRGITVCPEWDTFEQFLADVGERPAPGYSLDRIDVNGNYEKSNVRWNTQQGQSNNLRKNVFVEYQGRRLTCAEWARETGLTRGIIQSRIFKHGWTVEDALTTPAGPRGWTRGTPKTIEYQGRCLTYKEWERETGLAEHVIRGRAELGWSPEEILTTSVAGRKPRSTP